MIPPAILLQTGRSGSPVRVRLTRGRDGERLDDDEVPIQLEVDVRRTRTARQKLPAARHGLEQERAVGGTIRALRESTPHVFHGEHLSDQLDTIGVIFDISPANRCNAFDGGAIR